MQSLTGKVAVVRSLLDHSPVESIVITGETPMYFFGISTGGGFLSGRQREFDRDMWEVLGHYEDDALIQAVIDSQSNVLDNTTITMSDEARNELQIARQTLESLLESKIRAKFVATAKSSKTAFDNLFKDDLNNVGKDDVVLVIRGGTPESSQRLMEQIRELVRTTNVRGM